MGENLDIMYRIWFWIVFYICTLFHDEKQKHDCMVKLQETELDTSYKESDTLSLLYENKWQK